MINRQHTAMGLVDWGHMGRETVRTVNEFSETKEKHLCDCSLCLHVMKGIVESWSRTVVIQDEAEN